MNSKTKLWCLLESIAFRGERLMGSGMDARLETSTTRVEWKMGTRNKSRSALCADLLNNIARNRMTVLITCRRATLAAIRVLFCLSWHAKMALAQIKRYIPTVVWPNYLLTCSSGAMARYIYLLNKSVAFVCWHCSAFALLSDFSSGELVVFAFSKYSLILCFCRLN